MARDWLPRVASMGCLRTAAGGACAWHAHGDLDELCLVAEDGSAMGHGGERLSATADTLFLFRRGEQHGYWNSRAQRPDLWVLHYRADDALDGECPRLCAREPRRRMWRLDTERAHAFKGLFLKVLAEHRRGARAAESAWLRLLLVAVQRWAEGERAAATPALADPELIALWQVVSEHATRPNDLGAALARRVPNYDSLRHRFRRAFGVPPRRMVDDLRFDRAKTMLLETDLPIGDVAERLGYARQHEFARAFRRRVGRTPSAWRARPD